MPFFVQVFGDVVGAELGAGEHQHLAPVVFLDDVRQQRFLLAATDRVNQLGDALHRGVARRDLHAVRVFQQRVGEFADLFAEGGREQQALLVFGHGGQHFFHVMDEAHVEHAVGLVEHQDLHLAQVHHALLHQVKQAPGVATKMSTPFFMRLICGFMPTPPKMAAELEFRRICRRSAPTLRPGRQVPGWV